MQITSKDIESVEEAGTLDGSPVKLVKTRGGFWMAIGRLKGRLKEEAIAAGSHPAIVKFNIEKQFPSFQPAMMKSENFSIDAIVEKHTHFLTPDLIKSGHEIFSVQEGSEINFLITKHGINVNSINSEIQNKALVLEMNRVDKKFKRALAGATSEKALSCGIKRVEVKQNVK